MSNLEQEIQVLFDNFEAQGEPGPLRQAFDLVDDNRAEPNATKSEFMAFREEKLVLFRLYNAPKTDFLCHFSTA